MITPPHDLAEQVWQETLPALRARRTTRRAAALGAGAAAFLLAVFSFALWRTDTPAHADWITQDPPSPTTELTTWSMVVLVVDQAGARFEHFAPEELTDEGLLPDLTLDPVTVVTTPVSVFH